MYRVIENQHLAGLREVSGPVLLICQDGRPALMRHLVDGVRAQRRTNDPLDAVVDTPAATEQALVGLTDGRGWVVPVRVRRSRFARGHDRWSAASRWLSDRGTVVADRLNHHLLGAFVELVCEAPIAVDVGRTWAAAVAEAQDVLATPAPIPRIPPADHLWPDVQATLPGASSEMTGWLRKMANNYDLRSALLLRGMVHYLSRRFFRGIWVYGMSGIENLPPGSRLVYLPCHRSHCDYMVLPYVLNEYGQTCPVFAAGDNLNFFLIGRILQDGFAFFIRRTFGSDAAYRELCAAYLGTLLKHDVPMAFFPEGGRSRDGRMRSPKIGMLHMVREQVARQVGDDVPVYLVPVHVAYERCPEGKSLARQTLGRAKSKESIFRFAKSLKILVADHGRVLVSLGEPRRLPPAMADSPADREETQAIAREALQQIHTRTIVTEPALLAVALIARAYRADVADLVADSRLLAAYLGELGTSTGWPVMVAPAADPALRPFRGVIRRDVRVNDPLPDSDGRHSLSLLGLTVRGGQVAVVGDPLSQARLDWHLGAISHLLLPLAVVASYVSQLPQGQPLGAGAPGHLAATLDSLRGDATLPLYWPDATASSDLVAAVLIFLTRAGFLTASAGGWVPGRAAQADPEVWPRWATWTMTTDRQTVSESHVQG